jgi:hypothetical protein
VRDGDPGRRHVAPATRRLSGGPIHPSFIIVIPEAQYAASRRASRTTSSTLGR